MPLPEPTTNDICQEVRGAEEETTSTSQGGVAPVSLPESTADSIRQANEGVESEQASPTALKERDQLIGSQEAGELEETRMPTADGVLVNVGTLDGPSPPEH